MHATIDVRFTISIDGDKEFDACADGRRVRRDSERTVLEIPEPQGNHNAGDLAFGPDGHLYVAVGDGGSGGDRGRGHVEDWYDANEGGNGQDVTENLLGSVLRIDVDGRDDGKAYAIPEDNPLVGREGLDEHFAWGLRNPWRMSFDGKELYVADVGQFAREEVSLVTNGGNYGWNVREGIECFGADDCPDETPPDVRGGEPLVDPVVEYPHSGDADVRRCPVGAVVRAEAVAPLLHVPAVVAAPRDETHLLVAVLADVADVEVAVVEGHPVGVTQPPGEVLVAAGFAHERVVRRDSVGPVAARVVDVDAQDAAKQIVLGVLCGLALVVPPGAILSFLFEVGPPAVAERGVEIPLRPEGDVTGVVLGTRFGNLEQQSLGAGVDAGQVGRRLVLREHGRVRVVGRHRVAQRRAVSDVQLPVVAEDGT